MAGFSFNGVETSGFIIRELVSLGLNEYTIWFCFNVFGVEGEFSTIMYPFMLQK